MQQDRLDVAIIGAGPIGLEMAVACAKAGLSYVVLDAGQVGQTISWFAPGTHFFSSNERIAIAGVPLQTPHQTKSTREQYLTYLRGVVQQFDLDVRTYEAVTRIDGAKGDFTLTTDRHGHARTYRVRQVVLATGGTASPAKLDIPGEDLPHVDHYFRDPHTYFRNRVLVVGGRNSAVEAALRCHHVGATVSLSYRRPALDAKSIKYWLLPEISGLTESGRIAAYWGTVPTEITPTHVSLAGADGRTTRVEADMVLLLTGYVADMSLCRLAGVALNGPGLVPAYDERTMETNVPGIYVAGTVIAGTQASSYRIFLENCHVHVPRILASVTGRAAPDAADPTFARPES